MAFLDNSGDIILDAVLTDTGRLRLAQGDGSFKISKFALGDDEINYSLYNKNHASGSAYYDLEVLQTPVLEAFTNNTSNLKTKLLSISRTNVLYMPILKLAKVPRNNPTYSSNSDKKQYGPSDFFRRADSGGLSGAATVTKEKFYVAVDQATYDAMTCQRTSATVAGQKGEACPDRTGIIKGFSGGANNGPLDIIRIDQGLDTNEISPMLGLDSDLYESAYIVEIDYRLGRLKRTNSDQLAAVNYIDDDNIASYYVTSQGTADAYINPYGALDGAQTVINGETTKTLSDLTDIWMQVFEGPRGSTFHFRIQASQELNSSTYLFTQLGSSELSDASSNIMGFPTGNADKLVQTTTTYYIDTTIRIVGANTGYRLDIPVRYVKIK